MTHFRYVFSCGIVAKTVFWLVMLAIIANGRICAAQTIASSPVVNSTIGDMNFLIAKSVSKREALKYKFLGLSGPYWVPTGSQAKHIREKLRKHLLTVKGGVDVLPRLKEYKIQYIGYSQGKNRLIFVNGFCDSFWTRGGDWNGELVVVLDGGSCFFQGKYSLDEDMFMDIEVNGDG